ncbi:hypothetical protein AGMMS49938_04510 [Fibrobacterales bacterium]|nr:hypothetical protein AGMMS49938_04510 [Fibrobacterales bacterium]
MFFCAKPIIKSWIKKIIRIGKKTDAKTDAKKRIESWKKEFQIHSLTEPLSQKNKIAIEHKIEELCDIIDFCKERSLRPVLGIMPVTKVLRDAIPEEFIQTVFYDMVQEVQKKREVPVLDYYRSSEFLDSDLYSDSFLMNEKGRKVFTEKVLEDLFGIPK